MTSMLPIIVSVVVVMPVVVVIPMGIIIPMVVPGVVVRAIWHLVIRVTVVIIRAVGEGEPSEATITTPIIAAEG